VFYCILGVFFVVSSVTTGLYVSRQRFAQQYQDTRDYLYDTQYRFEAFQHQSVEEQARILDESLQMYEQLTEEQRRARIQQFIMQQQQQDALEELRVQIDELEQMIRYFDEQRQAIIEGLGSRLFIPPVYALHGLLIESQASLLSQSALLNHSDLYDNDDARREGVVGFLGFSNDSVELAPALSETLLHDRLDMLVAELELQMLLLEDLQTRKRNMDPHLRNFPTLWPISAQISSPFGWRANPFGGGSEFHRVIDLRSPTGTPIRAAGGGTVTFDGWKNGYGNTVIICHGNGYTTLYAHNSANLVYVGQRVERGDVIARVGTTGRTTGAHVHFEVRINGVHVNPRHYMLEHWS